MVEAQINIDWNLLKIQYEIFHEDVDALALENSCSPRVINYAVKREGWQRKQIQDIALDFKNITSADELTDEVIDEVKKRIEVLKVLKSEALMPKYIALESAIIAKALKLLSGIQEGAPRSTNQLKDIAQVLSQLKGGKVGQAETEDKNTPMKIQIMQKFGEVS